MTTSDKNITTTFDEMEDRTESYSNEDKKKSLERLAKRIEALTKIKTLLEKNISGTSQGSDFFMFDVDTFLDMEEDVRHLPHVCTNSTQTESNKIFIEYVSFENKLLMTYLETVFY
jgi:hypothetical protein